MAETSVIKEFLVRLGFTTDEAALQKFGAGIEAATKTVTRLALAMTATATTVAIGVERFASNLEKLYWVSQRTGTSATNIKAFSRAIEGMGGTAEAALASINGLTNFLRDNPGGEGRISGIIGHQLSTDKAEALEQIGEFFAANTKAGRGFLNTQYAAQWGVAPTMVETSRAGFGNALNTEEDRLRKARYEEAAEAGRQFMIQRRELSDWIDIIGSRLETALARKLGLSLEGLNTWLENHADQLVDQILNAISTLIKFFNELKPMLVWIYDKLVELDGATSGWSTKILAIGAAIMLLGGGPILGGILALTAAFVGLGGSIIGASAAASGAGAAAGGAAAGGLMGLLGRLGLAGVAGFSGWELGKWIDSKTGASEKLADFATDVHDYIWRAAHQKEYAMKLLTDHGRTPAEAAAMVAVLNQESSMVTSKPGDFVNGQPTAYGMQQLHPDRQAAYSRWARRMGYADSDYKQASFEHQVEYQNYDTFGVGDDADPGARRAGALIRANGGRDPQYAVEQLLRLGQRSDPAHMDAAVKNVGAAAVTLYAHNTFNVGDQAKAEDVAKIQKEVNADTVRNMQATVQ